MLDILTNVFTNTAGFDMGFFGALIGALASTVGSLGAAGMAAGAQKHAANMNYKANKERVAAENMNRAVDAEKNAVREHLGAVQRSGQGVQDAHKDVVNVMRDTYLRNSGMGAFGRGRKL